MPKKLPIGIDNFEKLLQKDYWFADKSLMIKDFIDSGSEIILITRPRRWGKTLNMSMLHNFFAPQVGGKATNNLFKDLQISKVDNGRYLKEHQGKYPVIFLSFKDVKESTFDNAIQNIKIIIRNTFLEHYDVLSTSEKLNEVEKKELKNITELQVKEQELEFSLQTLTRLLYKHYGKEVIVLIDEYDTPLNAAYGHYLDQMVIFMRNFLSAGLKSNRYLDKALMTGILRISQTSILSGLNNLDVFTVFNKQYNEYFGFTEMDVKNLLQHLSSEPEVKISLQAIRDWYNGYKIADVVLYNPWSIVKCLSRNELQAYWVRTADDSLLENIVANSSKEAKEKFTQLLQNKPIEGKVSEHIAFDNLKQNETALWSLLVFAGYLQPNSYKQEGIDYQCELNIPNYEVSLLYESIFKNWLEGKKFHYDSFIKLLLQGKVLEFTQELGNYILESASVFDVGGDGRRPEQFYHGFMFALVLGLRGTHDINSNRESGLGRYDIMIKPKQGNGHMAILLEFKHAKKQENIIDVAKTALKQIDEMQYQTELKMQTHITEVLKIGLAFSEKSVQSAFQLENLVKNEIQQELQLSSEIRKSDSSIYGSEESEDEEKRAAKQQLLPSSKVEESESQKIIQSGTVKKNKNSRWIEESGELETENQPLLKKFKFNPNDNTQSGETQKTSSFVPQKDSPLRFTLTGQSKNLSQAAKEGMEEEQPTSSRSPSPAFLDEKK